LEISIAIRRLTTYFEGEKCMKRKISGDRWMDGEMDEGKSTERD
jgi:hypothetical protein